MGEAAKAFKLINGFYRFTSNMATTVCAEQTTSDKAPDPWLSQKHARLLPDHTQELPARTSSDSVRSVVDASVTRHGSKADLPTAAELAPAAEPPAPADNAAPSATVGAAGEPP